MATRNQQEIRNALIGKPQKRTFERAAMVIDEEKRTVEMSFASDAPIEHWFGKVILDMKPESVMLDRWNAGAPLLVCHDRNQQVGICETPTIAEGKFRSNTRFSKRQFAEEIFQDVKDEIRKTTSLMFVIHEIVLEESNETEDIYRATLWEPYEGSLEPIPADISTGVGRSLAVDSNPADTVVPPVKENAATPPARATNQPTIETRNTMDPIEVTESADLLRAREIEALGGMVGEVELARDFIADDKTPAEFKAAVKAKRTAAQGALPTEDPNAVAARNGGTPLARVISRHGKLRNFKGEGAAERAYRFGMWATAALMGRNSESPMVRRANEFCRTSGLLLERAATESINEDGGFNVPTEFGNDLIDLREDYGVFRPNTKVVPMGSDSKTEPRRTGGLTAYPLGELTAITESKKGWDQVKLAAKEWGVLSKTSSAHNEDTVINWADDIMGEIAYAFAQKEDDCGFNGDGTSTYHGIQGVRAKLKGLSGTIANIAGLVVASGNLFSEFVLADFLSVKGRLPSYVYKRDTPKWFVHQTFWNETMEKLALAAGGASAAEIVRGATGGGTPTFLGYPVEIVQSMPHADANSQVAALFGSLRLASMLGDRKGTELAMTNSDGDDFASRILSIRGITRFDIVVHDVGNASATASARVPGPVIGLISAAS